MAARHALEIRVLGDDGQAVGDGGSGDERVGQSNGPVNAGTAGLNEAPFVMNASPVATPIPI